MDEQYLERKGAFRDAAWSHAELEKATRKLEEEEAAKTREEDNAIQSWNRLRLRKQSAKPARTNQDAPKYPSSIRVTNAVGNDDAPIVDEIRNDPVEQGRPRTGITIEATVEETVPELLSQQGSRIPTHLSKLEPEAMNPVVSTISIKAYLHEVEEAEKTGQTVSASSHVKGKAFELIMCKCPGLSIEKMKSFLAWQHEKDMERLREEPLALNRSKASGIQDKSNEDISLFSYDTLAEEPLWEPSTGK